MAPSDLARPTDNPRDQENRLLKIGYFAILQQRFPFQPKDKACYNAPNAYITSLEKEYLEIPMQLSFDSLKGSISEKHHRRLQEIWNAVHKNYLEYYGACDHLTQKWTTDVPLELIDPSSSNLMEESTIKIRADLQNAVKAAISPAEPGSPLKKWQREEKLLRRGVHDSGKIFTLSLRLYYEMLLESSNPSEEGEEKEYVLPYDHPLRNEIANRTRYLRLIDATQSGISIAKAAHHGQKKGRLRKTKNQPYALHELDVTHAAILDVVPYTLEEKQATLSVILGIVGSVHDVVEDTDLSLEDLVENYIKRLADSYDSSIDPLIQSGFGYTRDNIKKRVLNLIKDDILRDAKKILRILSGNCKLTKDERIKMAKESIAGVTLTKELLGISTQEFNVWGLKKLSPKTTNTFSAFPEEEDSDKGKSSGFIMRLTGLTESAETRQRALIFKLEDRANNMQDTLKPTSQRRVLRTTVSRVIAYAVLDHDNTKYPLYNALPRAIETALTEYGKLEATNPELIEEKDRKYVEKLLEWKLLFMRLELPPKIQAVLDRNRALQVQEALQAA